MAGTASLDADLFTPAFRKDLNAQGNPPPLSSDHREFLPEAEIWGLARSQDSTGYVWLRITGPMGEFLWKWHRTRRGWQLDVIVPLRNRLFPLLIPLRSNRYAYPPFDRPRVRI